MRPLLLEQFLQSSVTVLLPHLLPLHLLRSRLQRLPLRLKYLLLSPHQLQRLWPPPRLLQ